MKYKDKATDVLDNRPTCNLCPSTAPNPAAVDAKTRMGPWAYLCVTHHQYHGGRLGLGIGQVLLCGDELDAKLIEQYQLNKETVS